MNTIGSTSSDAILHTIMQLLPGLSQMLGPHQEVVLHDLRKPNQSVIGIYGSITNRTLGSPITNYVLRTLKTYGNDAPDRINYRAEAPNGVVLRSSTLFIRDHQGAIIGCLCFNSNITPYLDVMEHLRALTSFNAPVSPVETQPEEHFASDVTDMMKEAVKRTMGKYHIINSRMSKTEKMQIVQDLEEGGIFNIKGAVEYVATCLNVSIPTVYNYLKRAKSTSFPALSSHVVSGSAYK